MGSAVRIGSQQNRIQRSGYPEAMKPKQGTPSWISGGFLGKGYTLQESLERSESPSVWPCTKRKLCPHPPHHRTRGTWCGRRARPLALPSVVPTLLSPQGLTDPPGPPGKPCPSPRAPGSVLEDPSLPPPHSWEHRGLPWGGGGRANRPRKTSPTFSPASCCSGRTSPRAPAGPPGPERTRKCGKEPKGPRERARLAAGLGASLSVARSGPRDSPFSTRRWDSEPQTFQGRDSGEDRPSMAPRPLPEFLPPA